MSRALVLMFHGIDGPRSRAVGYSADGHYSVTAARFAAILEVLHAFPGKAALIFRKK